MDVYNQKWIAWQKVYMGKDIEPWGLCAWPFIFYRDSKEQVSDRMRRHEGYHFARQRKWLFFPFLYDICYIYLWFKHGYMNHPWEIAAREAENK